MKAKIYTFIATLAVLLSCAEETPSVQALFSTDKAQYMINEEILVANQSTAEFTIIGMCKWEWEGNVSYAYELEGLSFKEAGEYPITLTVYAEQGAAEPDSYTLAVTVFDNNKAPVPEFSVPEKIVQGSPVTFTDMSTDETGTIKSWDWDFGTFTSQEQNPTVIFDTYGEKEVTLTVTDSYGASATIKRIILVEMSEAAESNIPPVADFEIPETVIQYLPARLNDNSSDEDGSVVSHRWVIGDFISEEANPIVAFTSSGSIEVSLTVTDDLGATSVVTKTIDVKQTYGHDMKIDWEQTYDDKGYVYWTSPAVSQDGSKIYVSSTGYHLVCFDASGAKKGSYNIGEKGANPYSGASINNQSPTPSIDSEGNVYIPVQFYDNPTAQTTGNGGIFSIKPECAGMNWYFPTGEASSYRFLAPPVFGDYVAICLRSNDSALIGQNAGIINRTTGAIHQTLTCDQGSYGGMAVSSDGHLVFGAARKEAGYKVALLSGTQWTPSANSDAGRLTNFLNQGETKGGQPAISADGLVYVCVSANSSAQLICACYSLNDYQAGSTPTPLWTTTVTAKSQQCGYGAVLDKEGNAYFMSGDRIFRLNAKDGTKAWEYSLPEAGNVGVAAIDSYGFLYVCEANANRLLKLSSQDGKLLSSVEVSNPKSCPTIAPDGTVYVTGNKNGKPVLYKISGTGVCKSVAPGESWSQLGANPQKTGSVSLTGM